VSLAVVDKALFWKLTSLGTIVLAGAAYLFIPAMTPTSFDPTAPWPRPRQRRPPHLVGGWYIWISFAGAIGQRGPVHPLCWPMAALILAAGLVRLAAMWRRNRRRIAPA